MGRKSEETWYRMLYDFSRRILGRGETPISKTAG
jgi:hypothetical protein